MANERSRASRLTVCAVVATVLFLAAAGFVWVWVRMLPYEDRLVCYGGAVCNAYGFGEVACWRYQCLNYDLDFQPSVHVIQRLGGGVTLEVDNLESADTPYRVLLVIELGRWQLAPWQERCREIALDVGEQEALRGGCRAWLVRQDGHLWPYERLDEPPLDCIVALVAPERVGRPPNVVELRGRIRLEARNGRILRLLVEAESVLPAVPDPAWYEHSVRFFERLGVQCSGELVRLRGLVPRVPAEPMPTKVRLDLRVRRFRHWPDML